MPVNKEQGIAWVKELNEEYPEFVHYLEVVPSDDADQKLLQDAKALQSLKIPEQFKDLFTENGDTK